MGMATNVTQSVYSAEWAFQAMLDHSYDAPSVTIHGSTITLPVERKFATVESMQSYVDRVLSLNWVQQKYANAMVGVIVKEKKAQKDAHYEGWTRSIVVPAYLAGRAWAMREIVVLHELAHHLAPGDNHNAKFTAAYIDLLENVMSVEAGFILRSLYYDEGVKIA